MAANANATVTVTVTELDRGIYLAETPLGEEEDPAATVRAALLLGERRAAVVDTLNRPEDMVPFLPLLAAHGRPVTVVLTHADWDHAWGAAAFPGAPVVGHRACRERLLGPEAHDRLAHDRAKAPDRFAHVALVPPDVTFETALALDLGGLTLALHHLPGHTADSLLAHVPERRLLLAADCAEDPFPILGSGPLDGWVRDLRAWAARDIETVVPAHGAISGPELLRGNADYLDGLLGDDTGVPPGTPASYREIHAQNREAARRLATV